MPAYPAGAKLAALTFDDGPNKYTARLLDILKEKETPATFFVLGSWGGTVPGAHPAGGGGRPQRWEATPIPTPS